MSSKQIFRELQGMQMDETSEPTIMTFALTQHMVGLFSTIPLEINEDEKIVGEGKQNKTTKPSQIAYPPFIPPDQISFSHIKYIRSSESDISESKCLILV